MFTVESLILVVGVLLLIGIASSKVSARVGVPVLVLFLLVGMLAGSEGIGGIEFADYQLAYDIGTIALALILFDGGLSTPIAGVRAAWKPSLLLATAGVLITAVVTGVAASWIFSEMTLLEGMLLGSIVGSTDAAAVFAVLRHGGVTLSRRLSSTLEIESASNDPMAIFLTVGCIEVLTGRTPMGPELIWLLVMQFSVGTIVGIGMGFVAVWVVNRIQLDTAGLYPVLVTAFGFLIFGIAAWLGGSGFLAVYLAGVVMGNSTLVFQRGILLFHDAGAWLSQIVLFVMLGLLSFPSRLLSVSGRGLLLAAVLLFLARPIAVLLTATWFKYNWRELVFVSWVGLKGAVPITLATFPLLYGVNNASLFFDVVFFVVALSAVVQGWSLPVVARWLRLEVPTPSRPPVTLELSSLRHVEGDIVDYSVGPDSRAAGKCVKDLALPDGVVIALIARAHQIIPPKGNTRIEPGDHVVLVLRPGTRPLVNQVFATKEEESEVIPSQLEFPLRGSITVGVLEEFYSIRMSAPPDLTLDEAVRRRLKTNPLEPGAVVRYGQIALRVREVSPSGTIEQVGMIILPDTEPDDSSDEDQDNPKEAGSTEPSET